MLSFSRVAGGHQYIRHRCGISREQKASTLKREKKTVFSLLNERLWAEPKVNSI